jgi:capsular exopolysaccharide synthesis family protein
MSQIFEALQRSSGKQQGVPAIQDLHAAAQHSRISDADSGLDRVPSFNLAVIPEHRLVSLHEDRSPSAERVRILSARLRQMQQQRRLKTLLLTSSIEKEGKSFLSANLAVSFARTRQRVLLIDGDVHRATLARLLGAPPSPGLTGWWASGGSILNCLRRANEFPLWFLPAGDVLEFPLEMLQSARLAELLAQIAEWFDWIMIDSPPIAPLADAAVWSSLADGILLVLRQGRTPMKLLARTLDSLDGKKLLGMVLNECSDVGETYYKSYYGRSPSGQTRVEIKQPRRLE